MPAQAAMVNPTIFQDLQARIDQDTAVREVSHLRGDARDRALIARQELRDLVQALEKHSRQRTNP